LVETFYDTRVFPVSFDTAVGAVNVQEKILNHEDFTVSVR
jgi:hypothetical protein